MGVLISGCHLLHLEENGNELWHDEREASNTDEKDQRHRDSLDLTFRIEVSKTHGGQRSEYEVDDDRQVVRIVSIFQLVDVIEGVFIYRISSLLGQYEPHGAKEVREDQDEDDEAAHLEALDEENLLHDLVVVDSLV